MAIIKQEPELLDELAIVLRANTAFGNMAETLGKNIKELTEVERRLALTNEVLRQTANDGEIFTENMDQLSVKLSLVAIEARKAQIAIGREFQAEANLGVDGVRKFLAVAEESPRLTVFFGELATAAAATFAVFKFSGGSPLATTITGIVTFGAIAAQEIANVTRELEKLVLRSDLLAARNNAVIDRVRRQRFDDRFGPSIAGEGSDARVVNAVILETEKRINKQIEERIAKQEELNRVTEAHGKALAAIQSIIRDVNLSEADAVTKVVLRSGELIEKLQRIARDTPKWREDALEAIRRVQEKASADILGIQRKQADEESRIAQEAVARGPKRRAGNLRSGSGWPRSFCGNGRRSSSRSRRSNGRRLWPRWTALNGFASTRKSASRRSRAM